MHDCRIELHAARPVGSPLPLSQTFRLVEVELYAYSAGVYEDRFTHCDPQQGMAGTWYFHKKGGTYKNGSFKGLDVTFGTGSGVSVGVLIRSISRILDTPPSSSSGVAFTDLPLGDVTEGPSLVVDTLLAAAGFKTIAELVGSKDGVLMVDPVIQPNSGDSALNKASHFSSHIRLRWTGDSDDQLGTGSSSSSTDNTKQKNEDRKRNIAQVGADSIWQRLGMNVAPRVGLIPRTPADLTFAGRLLRFIHPKVCLAKQRAGVIAAILAQGAPVGDVSRIAGGTAKNIKTISTFIQAVEQKKLTLAAISRQVTSEKQTAVEATDVSDAVKAFAAGGVLGGDVMMSHIIAAIVAWASASDCL